MTHVNAYDYYKKNNKRRHLLCYNIRFGYYLLFINVPIYFKRTEQIHTTKPFP